MGALFLVSTTVYPNSIWVIVAMCLAKGLTYTILSIGPTIIINEMPERGGLMASILVASGNIAGVVVPLLIGYIISLAGVNKIAGYNLSILFIASIVLIFGVLFAIFTKPRGEQRMHLTENLELNS